MSALTPEQEERKAQKKRDKQLKLEKLDEEKRAKKFGGWKATLTKVVALVLVISLVGSIPWILTFASSKLVGHQEYFYYLGIFYLLVELFIFFYWQRQTITFNSFATQNMVWSIFTMGFYLVVDLPKYLPVHLRQIALYLWCSFTMIFNLIWFFMDDTNYVEEEQKENLKEEKRKKRDEKRKLKEMEENKENLFSPRASMLINIIIYGTLIIGGAWYGYQYYQEFQLRSQINNPVEYQPPDEF